MKVLAKLGLVTAAAATVLFIFIYEIQGPVLNRVMSEAPPQVQTVEPVEAITTDEPEQVPLPSEVEEVEVENQTDIPAIETPAPETISEPVVENEVEEQPTTP